MSRRHIQECRSNAGLRVEERLCGEGWGGVWGNVGPRFALEISQSWFGLLLVPESRDMNSSSSCACCPLTGCSVLHLQSKLKRS